MCGTILPNLKEQTEQELKIIGKKRKETLCVLLCVLIYYFALNNIIILNEFCAIERESVKNVWCLGKFSLQTVWKLPQKSTMRLTLEVSDRVMAVSCKIQIRLSS